MVEYITKERARDLIVAAAHENGSRLACMLSKLEDEPPADVAPVVHGEWVMKPTHMGYLSCCSECGFCAVETNYCPQCGARMDGGESGD